MKAQVVNPSLESTEISRRAQAIIFSRRPSIYDFLAVIKDAPWIQAFFVCGSYCKNMSKNIQTLCDLSNVKLIRKTSLQGRKNHLDGSLVDVEIKEETNQ